MPHLPQPARTHGRAMTTMARRTKRPVAAAKPARAKRTTLAADLAAADVALAEAPEAAAEMFATDGGEG